MYFPGVFKIGVQVDKLANMPLLPAELSQVRTGAQREIKNCTPGNHAWLRRRKKINPLYQCSIEMKMAVDM